MVAQVGQGFPLGSRFHAASCLWIGRSPRTGYLPGSGWSFSGLFFSCLSSSILMRSDFRNLRSWSLILNSGLVDRVVTREVLSEDFSPCLLTPMVASRTRNMSYPPSL